jgi:hypothetical protein
MTGVHIGPDTAIFRAFANAVGKNVFDFGFIPAGFKTGDSDQEVFVRVFNGLNEVLGKGACR